MSSWVGLEWSSIIFGENGIIQEMPNACQYSSLLSTVTYLEWTSALSRERQRYNLQYQNGAPGSAFWPLFGITDHAGLFGTTFGPTTFNCSTDISAVLDVHGTILS